MKGSYIVDIAGDVDFDNDGKKEAMIFFGDESGTTAFGFLELQTGEEKLVTLLISDSERASRINLLTNEINTLNQSIRNYENDISDLQQTISEKESQRSTWESERRSLQNQIQVLNSLIQAKIAEGLDVSSEQAELTSLNNRIDNLNEQITDVSEEINSLDSDLTELRDNKRSDEDSLRDKEDELRNLEQGSVSYINGYDFCNGNLFLTAAGNIYSFDSSLVSEEIQAIVGYPYALACVNDLNGDGSEELAVVSAQGIKAIDLTGEVIEEVSFEDSILNPNSAIRVRSSGMLYIPSRLESQTKVTKFNLNLDNMGEDIFNVYPETYSLQGETLICGVRHGVNLQAFILGKSTSVSEFEGLNNLDCDNIILSDCDDNSAKKPALISRGSNGINLHCGGSRGDRGSGRNYDWEDEKPVQAVDSSLSRRDSPQIEEGSSARISGDYIILQSGDEQRQTFNDGSIQKPKFPYEVYSLDGQKQLISLDPVFISNNNIIDQEGNNVLSRGLIQNHRLEGTNYRLNFQQQGQKVIFVNDMFYDMVQENFINLKLVSGNHKVETFLYNDGYYQDEVDVYIPRTNNISFVSILITILFILVMIFMFMRKRWKQ